MQNFTLIFIIITVLIYRQGYLEALDGQQADLKKWIELVQVCQLQELNRLFKLIIRSRSVSSNDELGPEVLLSI